MGSRFQREASFRLEFHEWKDSQVMRWFMARLIEFYTRQGFNPKVQRIPADQMGKLIEFPGIKIKKSA
jgi:hypothetical protein